jgi:hypothetical protein
MTRDSLGLRDLKPCKRVLPRPANDHQGDEHQAQGAKEEAPVSWDSCLVGVVGHSGGLSKKSELDPLPGLGAGEAGTGPSQTPAQPGVIWALDSGETRRNYGVQASLAFPFPEITFGLSTSTWNQWSPAASTLNFSVKVFVPEAVKA